MSDNLESITKKQVQKKSNNIGKKRIKKEAENDFKYILVKYILPIIKPNADLKPHHYRRNFVKNKRIEYNSVENRYYFYPCHINPILSFTIDCEYNFKTLKIARVLLDEIMKVSQYNYQKDKIYKRSYYDREIDGEKNNYIYRYRRYELAYELGLCDWLGGGSLIRLLEEMNSWSLKTYEGKNVAFGFIINTNKNESISNNIDFIKFLKSKHSAVFSDGINSGITLDYNGKVVEYFSTDEVTESDKIPYTPLCFAEFAKRCDEEKVGVILLENSDILVIKGVQLVFAKRRGKWHFLNSNNVLPVIDEHISKDIKKLDRLDECCQTIYLAILDISYMRHGGCIAIINEEHEHTVKSEYCQTDLLSNKKLSDKNKIIRNLIKIKKNSFFDLNRNLQQDLLSLDGALVLDSRGEILCAGAIIKVKGGSNEGGRTAATKELAKYGLAIKISEDGNFTGYSKSKTNKGHVEVVFTGL